MIEKWRACLDKKGEAGVNYLTGRLQQVRINSHYSTWVEILVGVPQGSILGSLLFNIYLCDFFLFINDSDIANYVDDNSPFACEGDIKSVLGKLEEDSSILVNWIRYNGLKANSDKFHLLLSDHDEDHLIRVTKFTIQNSKSERLLGIRLDNGMTFDSHVSEICNKASQKIHALSRVCRFMGLTQRKILMQAVEKLV